MTAAALSLLAVLGLLVGVAVRDVVWCLAVEEPPRTSCPNCDAAARRLIGVVRPFTGVCASCAARSFPPPLVTEVLCAAGFALSGWIGGGVLRVAAMCWLTAFGLAAALVDAAVHRLPDALTWPCSAGVILFSCWQAFALGSASSARRTVLAGLAMATLFLVLALAFDVGLGDAKLAAGLGAGLGYASWTAVVTGVSAGILLAGTLAAASMTLRRSSRSDHVALGPPLLAGALFALAAAAR